MRGKNACKPRRNCVRMTRPGAVSPAAGPLTITTRSRIFAMALTHIADSLNAEQARSVLSYDQVTGQFTWKARTNASKSWNTRYANAFAGAVKPNGYLQIGVNERLYLAHRLAWLWMTGQWPVNEIDHIDGNAANNAWINLRAATSAQNKMNKRIRSDNTSGLKGIWLNRKTGSWAVDIGVDGKRVRLHGFLTPEAAHAAYCDAATRLHGTFARFS